MTELERELRGLAAAVAFPETPEIAANVRLEPRTRAAQRRGRGEPSQPWRPSCSRSPWPPASRCRRRGRRSCTVRDRRGSRSSSSTACPRSGPDAPLDLGTAIDPADAPFPLLRPALLGEPDGIYRAGDVVTLLYGTPERVRALITEIADSGFTPAVGKKLAAAGTRVEFVPISGQPSRRSGSPASHTSFTFPAGPDGWPANTLIWTRGRLTIRLEGAETLQQARAIAESFG